MGAEVTWIVLHGSSQESGGIVTFETALAGLVAVLVVVGALYYVGALDPADSPGDEEQESGIGD